MVDERSHHVTVTLAHDYQFLARFGDPPDACAITFDEPEPVGGHRGPNAAAVLGAAMGNYLAASLALCVRRSRIHLAGLTANVTTHVTRNDNGRYPISGIDVELAPVVASTNATRVERCEGLLEDFCTVTASVEHGIPVHVSLKDREHETAA
jgi:uncharacterized OsmC-like protein